MLAHSLTAHDQLGAAAAATQKSNACLSSEVRAGAKRAKHTLPGQKITVIVIIIILVIFFNVFVVIFQLCKRN